MGNGQSLTSKASCSYLIYLFSGIPGEGLHGQLCLSQLKIPMKRFRFLLLSGLPLPHLFCSSSAPAGACQHQEQQEYSQVLLHTALIPALTNPHSAPGHRSLSSRNISSLHCLSWTAEWFFIVGCAPTYSHDSASSRQQVLWPGRDKVAVVVQASPEWQGDRSLIIFYPFWCVLPSPAFWTLHTLRDQLPTISPFLTVSDYHMQSRSEVTLVFFWA